MMRAGSWEDHPSGSECSCVDTVSSEPFLHKGCGASGLTVVRPRPAAGSPALVELLGVQGGLSWLSAVLTTGPILGNEG